MKTEQINKTNMYRATQLVLNDPANRLIWSGVPAIVRAEASHTGSLNVLASLAQIQGTKLNGISLDKDRLRESVVSRLLIVAGAAGAYAFESGNRTLAAKFEVKEGALRNLRDAVLDDVAQTLHDEAQALVTEHAAAVADYNLTPALLADLQSAITAYSGILGVTRAAVANRSAATAAIEAEIDRADANLKNTLDRLMRQFEAESPQFTMAYATARKIVNTAATHNPSPAPAQPVIP